MQAGDLFLLIIIIIIFLFLLPDSKIIKLGKRKVLYYVEDSQIDKNFVESVIKIISSSNWNKTFNLINTKNKNETDIFIKLAEENELDKWNNQITEEFKKRNNLNHADDEILPESPKYYKDGKPIRYSITTQSPISRPKVFIDSINWLYGVKESGLSLENYKRYVINHELGHALGYDHNVCNKNNTVNGVCPVMHQSTTGCGMFSCGYDVSIYDYDHMIAGRYLR